MSQNQEVTPYASVETLVEVFREIRDQNIVDEEEFVLFIQEVQIFETVVSQIFTLFYRFILNEENESMKQAAEKGLENLIKGIRKQMLGMSLEKQHVPIIPGMTEIVQWVANLYKELTSQLFNKDFQEIVISPAIDDIMNSILEETVGQLEEQEENNADS